jgi:hypothetical protein
MLFSKGNYYSFIQRLKNGRQFFALPRTIRVFMPQPKKWANISPKAQGQSRGKSFQNRNPGPWALALVAGMPFLPRMELWEP